VAPAKKKIKAKRTGSMAQVAEQHLPSRHKALSSNCSTTKKKRKKERKRKTVHQKLLNK
jgi:hypothetical protein